MGVFICIIIILAIGVFIGYKFASWHYKRSNDTIAYQNALLTHYTDFWSATSSNRHQLYGQIAREHTGNISATLNTVIHLLNSLQSSQTQNLNREEQKVIADIITQARSISPRSSEFEE